MAGLLKKPELELPKMEVPLNAETARSLLQLVLKIRGAVHERAPYGRKAMARIRLLIDKWDLPTGPGILLPGGEDHTARQGELGKVTPPEVVAPRAPKNSRGRPKGKRQKKKAGKKAPIKSGVQPSGLIVP